MIDEQAAPARIDRPVAPRARDLGMRPLQAEVRIPFMVEARGRAKRFRVVAGCAVVASATRGELTLMGISVTLRASSGPRDLEQRHKRIEAQRACGARAPELRVAFIASHREVRSLKRRAQLRVQIEVDQRGAEAVQRVTSDASTRGRSLAARAEATRVRIGVTGHAVGIDRREEHARAAQAIARGERGKAGALRSVTCGAGCLLVRALERESGRLMLHRAETKQGPPRDLVTALACASIGSSRELAVVRVGMAVTANAVRGAKVERGARVSMASRAGHRLVLALERIDAVARARDRARLPSGELVAGRAIDMLTGERRLAGVRIAMTRVTAAELERFRLRGIVALGAGHRAVQSPQREARLRVVEAFGLYLVPSGRSVAARALEAEPGVVGILVTITARGLEPDPTERGITSLARGADGGAELVRAMAITARDARVLAFERKAGARMIEPLDRRIPVDQLEVEARMLRVATGTGRLAFACVEPATLVSQVRDLGVAREALRVERALAGAMAAKAVLIALELRVRLRERAGRDLRARASRSGQPDHPDDHEGGAKMDRVNQPSPRLPRGHSRAPS